MLSFCLLKTENAPCPRDNQLVTNEQPPMDEVGSRAGLQVAQVGLQLRAHEIQFTLVLLCTGDCIIFHTNNSSVKKQQNALASWLSG